VLTAERRQRIVEVVETRRSVSVSELCEMMEVSDMTIRRDLKVLSDEGMLDRVHGGALACDGSPKELPYLVRATENIKPKATIGRRAAELITEGSSIALDIGTTTLELAKAMVRVPNLTVVTASLPVAEVLKNSLNIRLILTGGLLRFEEFSLVGEFAERTFRDFQVDRAFVGVGGIDLNRGLTDYDQADIQVKKELISNSDQVTVLADSSKFDCSYPKVFALFSQVDTLITDRDAPPEGLELLTSMGIEVVLAE
jgi:DeoR/GlpR family transcriptional regulator of sugar metabolism